MGFLNMAGRIYGCTTRAAPLRATVPRTPPWTAAHALNIRLVWGNTGQTDTTFLPGLGTPGSCLPSPHTAERAARWDDIILVWLVRHPACAVSAAFCLVHRSVDMWTETFFGYFISAFYCLDNPPCALHHAALPAAFTVVLDCFPLPPTLL